MSCSVGTVRLPGWLAGVETFVAVRAHVLLPIFTFLSVANAGRQGCTAAVLFMIFLLRGPLLWATVLAFCLGSAAVAARSGQAPEVILLWPLGTISRTNFSAAATPWIKVLIDLAGLATLVLMACLWFVLVLATGYSEPNTLIDAEAEGSEWFRELFSQMFFLNVVMFVFNALVPCYPLMCARILMNLLSMTQRFDDRTIALSMVYVSSVVLLAMFAFGLYALFESGEIVTLLVAIYLAYCNYQLYQSAQNPQKLQQHPLFAVAEPIAPPSGGGAAYAYVPPPQVGPGAPAGHQLQPPPPPVHVVEPNATAAPAHLQPTTFAPFHANNTSPPQPQQQQQQAEYSPPSWYLPSS